MNPPVSGVPSTFTLGSVGDALPPLLRAVKLSGHPVVWMCDPMHGNTVSMNGVKTREYRQIVRELTSAFEIHVAEGTPLGGASGNQSLTRLLRGRVRSVQHSVLSTSWSD